MCGLWVWGLKGLGSNGLRFCSLGFRGTVPLETLLSPRPDVLTFVTVPPLSPLSPEAQPPNPKPARNPHEVHPFREKEGLMQAETRMHGVLRTSPHPTSRTSRRCHSDLSSSSGYISFRVSGSREFRAWFCLIVLYVKAPLMRSVAPDQKP